MTTPTTSARFRLAALWLAVFARALGENAVRAYAVMLVGNGEREPSVAFLFLWLGMTAVPAFALAAGFGAVASSRFRSTAMTVATVVGLGVIAWSGVEQYRTGQVFWLGCITVLAVESAFFSACRFSLIPESVRAARIALPQAVGLFSIATGTGIGVGLWIGLTQFVPRQPGLPFPLQCALVGYGLALVAVLLARFPVERPMPVSGGLVKPLLKTAGSIARNRDGRNSLLALWGMFAVGLVVNQWLFPAREQPVFVLFLVGGLAIGSLHANAFRTLGLVPYAATGLAVSAIWAKTGGNWFEPSLAMAVCMGLAFPPLLTTFTIYQPDNSRGHGGALLHAGWSLLTGLFLIFLVMFVSNPEASRPITGKFVVGLSLLGAIFAWAVFFRPTFELTWEGVLWPNYRIRGAWAGRGRPALARAAARGGQSLGLVRSALAAKGAAVAHHADDDQPLLRFARIVVDLSPGDRRNPRARRARP